MTITAYLAGPDVFLPAAREHARRKVEVCARHGVIGRAPLDEEAGSLDTVAVEMTWDGIFRQNLAMMEASDIIIANLTPFRGASADAGTLVELGWFLGRGRPVFGYSHAVVPLAARSRRQIEAVADPLRGLAIEEFGLSDNLMVAGALLAGDLPLVVPHDGRERAFDALDVFERCVALAVASLADRTGAP
jgi:nucleoside 2-deoxyribosyltransferase